MKLGTLESISWKLVIYIFIKPLVNRFGINIYWSSSSCSKRVLLCFSNSPSLNSLPEVSQLPCKETIIIVVVIVVTSTLLHKLKIQSWQLFIPQAIWHFSNIRCAFYFYKLCLQRQRHTGIFLFSKTTTSHSRISDFGTQAIFYVSGGFLFPFSKFLKADLITNMAWFHAPELSRSVTAPQAMNFPSLLRKLKGTRES